MDDYCQVCGAEIQAFVRSFESYPFVDGRNYDLVCWTCACVIKYWYINDAGEVITLERPDPDHLYSVQEMIEDGWNKAKAEHSHKAIQKKLKSPRVNIDSEAQHIYAQLFLSDTKEMVLEF